MIEHFVEVNKLKNKKVLRYINNFEGNNRIGNLYDRITFLQFVQCKP